MIKKTIALMFALCSAVAGICDDIINRYGFELSAKMTVSDWVIWAR